MSFPGGSRKALRSPYHQRERREYSVFPRLSPTRTSAAYQVVKRIRIRGRSLAQENSFPGQLKGGIGERFPRVSYPPGLIDAVFFSPFKSSVSIHTARSMELANASWASRIPSNPNFRPSSCPVSGRIHCRSIFRSRSRDPPSQIRLQLHSQAMQAIQVNLAVLGLGVGFPCIQMKVTVLILLPRILSLVCCIMVS